MKSQQFCGPVLGSLVYQLLGGVTLAYDLRLGCMIARWKGIYRGDSNGIHCVEFPGERGKRLLNLNLGELLALLEKLCFLVCGRLAQPIAGRVEYVQPIKLHEMTMCIEGIFALCLQPC
jgi:hypothetical protein